MTPYSQPSTNAVLQLNDLQNEHPIPPIPATMRNKGDYYHAGTYQERQPYQQQSINDHQQLFQDNLQNWHDLSENNNPDLS